MLTIRNPARPTPVVTEEEPIYHCALAGPPECPVPVAPARPAA